MLCCSAVKIKKNLINNRRFSLTFLKPLGIIYILRSCKLEKNMTVIIIKEEFDTIKTPTRPVFFMLRRKLVFTRILYSHSNKSEIGTQSLLLWRKILVFGRSALCLHYSSIKIIYFPSFSLLCTEEIPKIDYSTLTWII